MTTLEEILHMFIFIGIIGGLAVWLVWGFNHKSRINYILSPVLYFLHMLLFYILITLNLIPDDIYIIWIDLVYLHSIFVLISAGIVMSRLIEKEDKQ